MATILIRSRNVATIFCLGSRSRSWEADPEGTTPRVVVLREQGNTQVRIPVRELRAWIESNILLELAAAPFSKEDATLVTEVGSCVNCPKR
jgi:hypothetical protein